MSTTYVQTIDDLKLYAERSVQDKDGNQIDTTYAKTGSLAAVATSGDYDDLTNKPSIPAPQVNADWDATSGVGEILNKPTIPSVDQTYDGSSTNAQSGTAVAGAIATVNQVPASTSADQDKVLTVDSLGVPGWAIVPQSPTELFEASYGVTSYSDVRAAITGQKVVYCRVPSGANGYRMAFLAYIGSSNVEFQYYRSLSTHDSTDQGDEVYVYTVASSGWTTKTRKSNIRYKAGTNMTQSYSSSTETLTFSATVPTKTSDLTNDSGFITLSDIPAQVNADWDATSGAGQILNKPNLATVATTGDYSDLSGTPSIPTATSDLTNDSGFITLSDVPAQVQPDWNASSGLGEILNKPNLATVATTGAYSDLTGTPSIPTATSDLTNDSGFITLSDVPAQVNADWNASSGAAQILNKPTIPAAQVNADWNAASGVSQILNKPSLATVATTGAYADLSGKPTIPSVDQTYNAASTNAQSGTAVAEAVSQGVLLSTSQGVRCGTFAGDAMYTKLYEFTGTVGTSETIINMNIDEKVDTDNVNRIWLDPSNSWVIYGSAGTIALPITWRMGANREGGVNVVGTKGGALTCRCIDTSSTPLRFRLAIKYTVSSAS